MARPLIWALGTLASVSLLSFTTSQRLRAVVGIGNPPPALAAATPALAPNMAGRTLTLQADFNGHFTAHATVNGRTLRTMVDTGASVVALRAEDAVAIGAHKARTLRQVRFSTANGVVTGSIIRLDEVRVGDIVVRDVEAAIMPPGALSVTLLGMSFLRGLNGFEVSRGRLIMKS